MREPNQTPGGIILPSGVSPVVTAEPTTDTGFTHPEEVVEEMPAFLKQGPSHHKETRKFGEESRTAEQESIAKHLASLDVRNVEEWELLPRPGMVLLKDLRMDDDLRVSEGGLLIPSRTDTMQELWPIRTMEVMAVGMGVWEYKVGDYVYISNVKGLHIGTLIDPHEGLRLVHADGNGGIWGHAHKKGTPQPVPYSAGRRFIWWLRSFWR